MSAMASQITGVSIVCSTVYLGAEQRKHQSSASLAFVGGIHRWPVDSSHKGPVTQKIFQVDDVIMLLMNGSGSISGHRFIISIVAKTWSGRDARFRRRAIINVEMRNYFRGT